MDLSAAQAPLLTAAERLEAAANFLATVVNVANSQELGEYRLYLMDDIRQLQEDAATLAERVMSMREYLPTVTVDGI